MPTHQHLTLLMLACISVMAVGPAGAQKLRWAEEFTPCTASVCVNGGINTTNWSFHIGDGSDYGIPGEWTCTSMFA